MAGELKDRMIGGAGKVAEVDGGYFGGYVKPRQPERQAPVCRDRPRARRQLSPGRLQERSLPPVPV